MQIYSKRKQNTELILHIVYLQ